MTFDTLAKAAAAFLDGLPKTNSALSETEAAIRPDAGAFRDIFRETVPLFSGAYWFFLPDGTVFDIGKSDWNIWARI